MCKVLGSSVNTEKEEEKGEREGEEKKTTNSEMVEPKKMKVKVPGDSLKIFLFPHGTGREGWTEPAELMSLPRPFTCFQLCEHTWVCSYKNYAGIASRNQGGL
jgi:hypothetical protein